MAVLVATLSVLAGCGSPLFAAFPPECDFERLDVGWSGSVTIDQLGIEGLDIPELPRNLPVDVWVSAEKVENVRFRVFCMRVPDGIDDGPWLRGDVGADWQPPVP
jgi:hypothetical protein